MDRLGLRPTLAATLVVLALGCPGDDGTAEDGPEPTTNNGTTNGTTSEPTTEPTATETSATTTSATTTSTTEPATGDTTGSGVDCGEMTCGEDEYCDWSADGCGEAPSESGTCMPRPKGCPANYEPVCGCDGQVHGNACGAWGAGVDVAAEGACETPKGYFRCGPRFCLPDFTYCQVSISDVGGIGDGYECVFPAEPCEPPACDCLMMEPCFEFGCEPTMDGGIEIVCPGG